MSQPCTVRIVGEVRSVIRIRPSGLRSGATSRIAPGFERGAFIWYRVAALPLSKRSLLGIRGGANPLVTSRGGQDILTISCHDRFSDRKAYPRACQRVTP